MLKLYGMGPARSARCEWTLRELGLEYSLELTNLQEGAHTRPDYLAVNPYGKVPALQDGDRTLVESAAICLYLAEQHMDKGLLPPAGSWERAQVYQWLFTAVTDLEQPLWAGLKHAWLLPEEQRLPAEMARLREEFLKMARAVDQTLGEYAVGNSFTVADIVLGYTLDWATAMGWLKDLPRLEAYVERHYARPAAPKRMHTFMPAEALAQRG
jgi:glutathione S-transferase